jgi:hypothetical protein
MPRGHCLDYWHKWKREYNFCGLRPQDAKENDRYLILVDRIAASPAGLDGDFILEHFTAGAARPLLRCKDGETETKALNYVIACLKRGEDVTGGDLDATIKVFMGKSKEKPVRESTHLRTPDASAAPINESPVISLADRERAREMQEAGQNQQTVKDNKDSKCGEACPDCPDPCRSITKEELLEAMKGPVVKECRTVSTCDVYVNPGPSVMVNPVIINDTHRQSPFVTAAQLKAGEEAPADIGPLGPNMTPLSAPAEDMKAKRIRLADELMGCLSERFQMSVRDYLQYNHQNGEKTTFDVLYMGAEQMINKQKAPASSSGAAMRRS